MLTVRIFNFSLSVIYYQLLEFKVVVVPPTDVLITTRGRSILIALSLIANIFEAVVLQYNCLDLHYDIGGWKNKCFNCQYFSYCCWAVEAVVSQK